MTTFASIFTFVIYLVVAIIMLGIGIAQLRSKEPVGFYSGEQHFREEQLKNVPAWNKKHGRMWVAYGLIIMVSYGIGYLIGDSVWCLIPFCGGLIVPVIVMIWYHHKLIEEYKI